VESTPIPPSPVVLDVLENKELVAQYHEEMAKHLSAWRSEAVPAVIVKAVTRAGTAAHQEIIEAAQESNSDLIVIGNHGRTGLKRLMMGGTTEKVVRHAPCPVLVIREREHEFLAGESKRSAKVWPEHSATAG
jgi:universal stress protein A